MIRNYVKKYEAWVDLDPDEIELEFGTRKPSEKVLNQLFNDIENDNLQGVKDYISCDYDVNAKNKDGKTPLMLVCENDNYDMFKLLLKNNADVNSQDNKNKSALLYAILSKDFDFSSYFLEKTEKKLNHQIIQDILENTNLALNNHFLRLLFDFGGKPTIKQLYNCYSLREEFDLIKDKIKKYNLEESVNSLVDVQQNTLLTALVKTNHYLWDVKFLVNCGADVNHKDEHGFSSLILAIENNNDELAEFLLKSGADPNVKTKYGETPLMYACMHFDDEKIAELLLKYGADINAQDNNGNTALHYAVSNYFLPDGNYEMVKFLLEAGADSGIVNNQGLSPLENSKTKEIKSLFRIYCSEE